MSASACVPATAFGGRPFWLTHESLQSTLHSSMATKVPPRSLRRTGSLSLRPHRRRARAARSNARRRQEGRWMHFSQQTLKCRTVHCTACTGRSYGRRSGWGASAACWGARSGCRHVRSEFHLLGLQQPSNTVWRPKVVAVRPDFAFQSLPLTRSRIGSNAEGGQSAIKRDEGSMRQRRTISDRSPVSSP
mgnify:CR=1 FL=1